MSDFSKNAVKILNTVFDSENKVVVYSVFDGMFEVGDKLYIMVGNNGISFPSDYYKLDSYYNSGTTQSKNGYTLLSKDGNKLKLDLDYDLVIGNGESSYIIDEVDSVVECYIGRVYMKNTSIENGTLNGLILDNVKFNNQFSPLWKQGVIVKTSGNTTISLIDFKDKYISTDLILKTEINNGIAESYYTKNNYGVGISVINVMGSPRIKLDNCNIYSGSFYSCDLSTTNGSICYIYGGFLQDGFLGVSGVTNPTDKITIDGGYLYKTRFATSILAVFTWLNGTWYNDWTTSISYPDNPFNCPTWYDGTWQDGVFPSKDWLNGRFLKGTFNGLRWEDGIFNGNEFYDSFLGWYGGTFNGGLISGITWHDGTFNGGTISACTWNTGTLNGGEMKSCNWLDGVVNYGTIFDTQWTGGTFNDGTISGGTWNNGVFKGGLFDSAIWNNGTFHGGTLNRSEWWGGKFYNGAIFDSVWYDGQMFFGTVTNLRWKYGTWYDGIANLINWTGGTWNNGVFNNGTFYGGDWYDGSFNGGTFGIVGSSPLPTWYNGIFYFGRFDGIWSGGTFYTGFTNGVIPSKDYIGKEFVPYNKNGLVTKPQIAPRQPKETNNIVPMTIPDAKVTFIKKDLPPVPSLPPPQTNTQGGKISADTVAATEIARIRFLERIANIRKRH